MGLINLIINSFSGLSKEIWMLSLVTLINRLGAMVFPFLSVYLGTVIGFSITQVGWIMSAYGIGSMLGSLVGGKLTDRFGHIKVMIASLLLSCLAFLGLMYLNTFWQWLGFIMLATMIIDSFRPANFVAMDVYSTEENIKQTVKGKSPYTDWPFMLYMLLLFCSTLSFAQLIFTLPYFLKTELGFNEDIIGKLLGINGIIIFLFEMPMIYYLENRVRPKILIAIGAIMIGLSWLVLVGIDAYSLELMYGVLLLSILLITYGEIINFPYINVKVLAMADEENKGEYIGLYTMMWPLAMIAASPIGFNVADYFGWDALWMLSMGLSTVAAIGFYYFDDWVLKAK